MLVLKVIIIITSIMTMTANTVHNYIKAIDIVVAVQRSNTCVILVIDSAIQFVETEANASKELKYYGNIARNRNLHIRKTFEAQSTLDIIQKLSDIGRTRSTFLVYFTAGFSKPQRPTKQRPHQPPVTTESKNPYADIQDPEVEDERLIEFDLDTLS